MAGSPDGLAGTMTSMGGTSMGSPSKGGVKRALEMLESRVDSHADHIAGIKQGLAEQGSDVEDLLAKLKAELLGAIADVRAEMLGKIEETNSEVHRLDKALTEQKGAHGILSQQTKDSHKRIMEMSEQLHELNLELLGEPDEGS